MSGDLPRPWRVPLLVLGMVSLFGGTAAGLLRLGWNFPLPDSASVLDHGPLGGNARRPFGMRSAVGDSRGGEVDVQGIVHHITEIAAGGDMRESRHDALAQFVRRQSATYGQP